MIFLEETVKLSAFLFNEIVKCQYLTCKEILPPEKRGIIEKAKVTFSPLGKFLQNKAKQLKIKQTASWAIVKKRLQKTNISHMH